MQQASILAYLEALRPAKSGNTRPDRRHSPSGSAAGHTSYGSPSHARHRGRDRRKNTPLQKIAGETKVELAKLLPRLPAFDALESSLYSLEDLSPLNNHDCPNFTLSDGDASAGTRGTRIRVYDMDSFDVALQLNPNYKVHTHVRTWPAPLPLDDAPDVHMVGSLHMASSDSSPVATDLHLETETRHCEDGAMMEDAAMSDDVGPVEWAKIEENTAAVHLGRDAGGESLSGARRSADRRATRTPKAGNAKSFSAPSTLGKQGMSRPVAVLNLASERSPGGGWQKGALAQEECLCYRSSLYLSLHKSYYPLPSLSAIHSPNVLLIRDAMSRGHTLLTDSDLPDNLPVTSVISVAALRRPPLSPDHNNTFRNPGQRSETKRKIRLTLRMAAVEGHTKLVLGALGCGVFANPPKDVAECFLEVLREKEFQGGWWEEVAFAVLDNANDANSGKDGNGNFGIFYRTLHGQVV